MAGENELVTVFRSADADAEEQAAIARDILLKADIPAEIVDDSAAGVHAGVYEVRVSPEHQADADLLLEVQNDAGSETLDLSHDLDMVRVFVSEAPEAEMLATQIRSILEAQGLPSVLVSGSVFPNLPFEVRVPKERLDEARSALAAAEEAGPAAAEEAERESEGLGERTPPSSGD